jgi:hypothetical protein
MATIDELEKQLNDILKKKDSIYNDQTTFNTTMLQLIDKNYNFTQEQFNKFIICAVYRKSNSYLHSLHYKGIKIYQSIIKTFFNKFSPDNRQFKLLLSCYKAYSGSFYWLDVLFDRNYNFSDEQIELIKKTKYDMKNIFLNKGGMTQIDFENILKTWTNDSVNLQKLIEKNNIIVTKQAMINYLNSISYNYETHKDTYKSVIDVLFKFGCPPDSDYINILIKKNCIDLILFLSKEHNCKLLKEHLYYTIDSLSYIYWNIFLFFVDTVGPDKKSLDGMLSKCSDYRPTIKKFNGINYNGPIFPNGEPNLLEYIIEKGIEPDKETLYKTCKPFMIEYFDILTSKYKIYPDKKCLDIAINESYTIEFIKKILNFKIKPDEESFNMLLRNDQNRNKILPILFDNGLNINNDMIYKALKNKIIFLDLERYGINYDEKLYYYCNKYEITLPVEYINGFTKNINKNIMELRNLCTHISINIITINKYMVENSVIIDRYCLENLFKWNKKHAISYVKDFGCEPTLNCLYTVNYQNNNKYYKVTEDIKNELLEYFETKQDFDWKIMSKPYDIDPKTLKID